MRYSAALLIGSLTAQMLSAPIQQRSTPAVITLDIPAGVPSETIQVMTQLAGAFGGVGGDFSAQKPNLNSIEIEAANEGKPADKMLVTAYLPGCEFVTLKLDLTDNLNRRLPLVCNPLPRISISGAVPRELIQNHQAQMIIEYWGSWESFFGDGFVPLLELARIPVEQDGTFHAEITDFSKYESAGDPFTSLQFSLRDAKTWNFLTRELWLKPELSNLQTALNGVKVKSSYPELQFVGESPQATALPVVTIDLPPDVRSETMQVLTSMKGRFTIPFLEGQGPVESTNTQGVERQLPNLQSLAIKASGNGQPAREVTITAYAEGCDFATFKFNLEENPLPRVPFSCNPLPRVSIAGTIPAERIAARKAEIAVEYSATWPGGTADGFAQSFKLGSVPVKTEGTFEIEITDFSATNDKTLEATHELHFILREQQTGNVLARNLIPEMTTLRKGSGVVVRPSYPPDIRFIAESDR
jgi:hypothetical protein